jgi:hypothetical protein
LRRFRLRLALAASATWLLVACAGLPRGERPPAGRILNLPVHSLDGSFETLEIEPGTVGVVVVFATWCDACEAPLEAVRRMAEVAGGSLVPVAVSVDADPRLLASHLAEHPPGMRVVWDREGAAASRRLALEQVPTVLLVDRQGRIRRVFAGWDRGIERALLRSAEHLLAEAP